MLHNRSRRRKLAGATLQGAEGVKVPGVGELASMCANARRVSTMCDLLGVQEEELEHHDHLEDHANPPYIWDLDHA